MPKSVRPLANLSFEVRELAHTSTSLDIASYGFGEGNKAAALLRETRTFRLIIGVFSDAEITKARAFHGWLHAQDIKQGSVQLLRNCHMKVFVGHGKQLRVILGSSNLGGGSEFESAVMLTGGPARYFKETFDALWKTRARAFAPLDLREIAANLMSSSFTAEGVSR